MAEYKRNKIKTAWQIVGEIENWPTAFGMRLRQKRPGLRLLNFRNGLNIACRGGTRDWDIVHELYFAGSYGRAMDFLKALPGEPTVLDLGGNIGLFSLLAAQTHPAARVYTYEPGPPNYQMFELNCMANAGLSKRIQLRKEAVAGKTRIAEWLFDEKNPGGSGLFGTKGAKYQVQIRAFAEVLDSLAGDVALAKIDIEGAEHELLETTPPESWQRIQAISLELHDDPEGRMSSADFMKRMSGFGFKIEQETVCSFFLHR
jgi:FkbM family methyltransferase